MAFSSQHDHMKPSGNSSTRQSELTSMYSPAWISSSSGKNSTSTSRSPVYNQNQYKINELGRKTDHRAIGSYPPHYLLCQNAYDMLSMSRISRQVRPASASFVRVQSPRLISRHLRGPRVGGLGLQAAFVKPLDSIHRMLRTLTLILIGAWICRPR